MVRFFQQTATNPTTRWIVNDEGPARVDIHAVSIPSHHGRPVSRSTGSVAFVANIDPRIHTELGWGPEVSPNHACGVARRSFVDMDATTIRVGVGCGTRCRHTGDVHLDHNVAMAAKGDSDFSSRVPGCSWVGSNVGNQVALWFPSATLATTLGALAAFSALGAFGSAPPFLSQVTTTGTNVSVDGREG